MTPRGARAHVFVDDLEAPQLTEAEHHHLVGVLRMRTGDPVTAGDGRGGWRPCVLGSGSGTLEVVGPCRQDPPPEPRIEVVFAPTKGDRPRWAVQKLTELGVDGIHPLLSERSVVRWSRDREARHLERWRVTARVAASQCRRTWLPHIGGVLSVAEAGQLPGTAVAHPDGGPPLPRHTRMLVGPEGGWSETDLQQLTDLPRVRLSQFVLRAETAVMAAGAMLCGLRSQLIAPDRS